MSGVRLAGRRRALAADKISSRLGGAQIEGDPPRLAADEPTANYPVGVRLSLNDLVARLERFRGYAPR